jgi:hypothetical protein
MAMLIVNVLPTVAGSINRRRSPAQKRSAQVYLIEFRGWKQVSFHADSVKETPSA